MNEDSVLLSCAEDKMLRCSNDYVVTSTSFLDIHQQSVLNTKFSVTDGVNRVFWGGFDTAERNILVFSPDFLGLTDSDLLENYFSENPDDNPLTVLRLMKDSFSSVTHRDYLGALMGLGIKREMIGDIVVNDSGADIIAVKTISAYIKRELKSVGRASVTVSEIPFSELADNISNIREDVINVSSMRIDNVISACFRLSRSESANAVASGNIYVNSVQVLKSDRKVSPGDKIVYRTKGKIVLKEISGVSKKGRNFLKIDVYQ